jgi:hypothetical protein
MLHCVALTDRVRPKIGDVVEIPTPEGLAYAQFTHKHDAPPRMGALIRVLPGLFRERPADFRELAELQERFFVFFPLGAACNRRIVTIVANEAIPASAIRFPRLRAAGFIDRSGKVHDWWVFDGVKEERVGALTAEIARLSPCEVWNDTLLIERIASGWSPEQDLRLGLSVPVASRAD